MGIEKLYAVLELDASKGVVEIRRTGRALSDLGLAGETSARRAGAALDGLGGRIVAVNQLLELTQKAAHYLLIPFELLTNVGSKFENLQLQLTTVFKSAEKGKEYFDWILEFSKKTPFRIEGLGEAVIMLENFGINSKKYLTIFGDTASSLKIPIADLSKVMGQIFQKPTAQAEEMLQLVERGVPVTSILVEKLGLTAGQVANIGNLGIEGKKVFEALAEGMNERFGGAMANASKLWTGLVSTMQDTVELGLAKIANSGVFEMLKKELSSALDGLTKWLESKEFEQFAKDISSMFIEVIRTLKTLGGYVLDIVQIVFKYKDAIILAGEAFLFYFAANKVAPLISSFISGISGIGGMLQKSSWIAKSFFNIYRDGSFTAMSASQKMGLAINAATGQTSALFSSVGGLTGALQNLGPIAIAAFSGWQIGSLINDMTGLTSSIAELDKDDLWTATHVSQINNGLSLTALRAGESNEKIRKLGESLGVTNGSLMDSAVAIRANIVAYTSLTPEQKKLIDGFTQEKINIEANLEAIRKKKKADEEATKAINEINAAYETLAKTMGLITSKSYHELKIESQAAVKLFNENKDVILSDSEATQKFADKLTELTENFRRAKSDIPASVSEISTAVFDAKTNQELYTLSVKDTIDTIFKGFPTMQDQVDAFQAQHDKTGLLQDSLSSMGKECLKSLESSQKLRDGIANYSYQTKGAIEDTKDLEKEIKNLKEAFDIFLQASNLFLDFLVDIGVLGPKAEESLKGVLGGISAVGQGLEMWKKADEFDGLLKTLGKIGGAVGIVSGAFSILKGILSLFKGKSGELEAVERSLANLTGLTGDWAKKLEEAAKQLGGMDSSFRALNANLADMISNSDININNFDQWIEKVREIFSTYERGTASASETAANFGAAFESILEVAKRLGLEGGASMTGLILLADQFGMKIPEIQRYIDEANAAGLAGYKQMKDALNPGDLIEQISEAQAALKGYVVGSAEYIAAAANLEALKRKYEDIHEAAKMFGDVTIDVYEKQIEYENLVAKNQGVVDAIKGWETAMLNYTNVNRISQEEFSQYMGVAQNEYQKLIDSGFKSADAWKTIGPQLDRLIFLQNEYGFSVDASTQALIDQYQQYKSTSPDMRTDSEKLIDINTRMADALDRIAGIFEGRLPAAVGNFANTSETALGRVTGLTDNWGNALSDVDRQLSTTLPDSIDDLYDAWDGAMRRNSILPDTAEWRALISQVDQALFKITGGFEIEGYKYINITREISDEIRDQWADALEVIENMMKNCSESELPYLQQQWNYYTGLMQSDTNGLVTCWDGVVRTMKDALALQGKITAPGIGSRYGVYTEEEKRANTVRFYQFDQLFWQNRGLMLQDKDKFASFFRDVSALKGSLIADAIPDYENFMKKLENYYRHLVTNGEIWNDVTKSWNLPDAKAAMGLNMMLRKPTDIFVGGLGGYHILAGEEGPEQLTITPQRNLRNSYSTDFFLSQPSQPAASSAQVSEPVERVVEETYHINMPLTVYAYDTDEAVATKMNRIFTNNTGGVTTTVVEKVKNRVKVVNYG